MGEAYLDILVRIEKAQADVKNLKDEMAKLGTKSEQVNQTVRKEFENTGRVANKISGVFASIFTIGAIVGFLKKMVEVRMEWEKQVSILRTITGSQKEAQATMMMLQKVSDSTAATIDDVTRAYIRLVNAGVKPTYDQLKKIGDLSIITGKSFTQLAEAIYGASQKQIRGLRDAGIGAKINGDKITLSFKGMTQTIELTVDAMTKFLAESGGMAGVAGAAEELEKTVSGQFENIGESWHQLMLNMGESTDGFVSWVTKRIQGMMDWLNELTLNPEGYIDAKAKVDELIKSFEGLSKAEVGEELKKQQVLINEALTKIKADIKAYQTAMVSSRTSMEYMLGLNVLRKQEDALMDQIALLREYWKDYGKISVDSTEFTEEELSKIRLHYLNKWKSDLKEAVKANADLHHWYWEQWVKDLMDAKKLNEDYTEFLEDETKKRLEIIQTQRDIEEDEARAQLKRLEKDKDDSLRNEKSKEDILRENKARAAEAFTVFLSTLNQNAMDAELKAAGDSEEKKEAIRKKYGRREQALAISRAIISGAEAILKNNAQLGTILSSPINIWQMVITAAQVATIAAQKFAKGVQNLQGRGTGTSDSIPAMLSRGETVMTAEEEREFHPYLKAMKEGKFPRLQLELMNDFAKLQGITNNNLNYDNSKEIRELREIKRVLLREQQSEHIEGKYRVVRRGNITTKISLN